MTSNGLSYLAELLCVCFLNHTRPSVTKSTTGPIPHLPRKNEGEDERGKFTRWFISCHTLNARSSMSSFHSHVSFLPSKAPKLTSTVHTGAWVAFWFCITRLGDNPDSVLCLLWHPLSSSSTQVLCFLTSQASLASFLRDKSFCWLFGLQSVLHSAGYPSLWWHSSSSAADAATV